MSSESELDDELLQVAGQGRKQGMAGKRKRSRKLASDSEEDVSLEEESDWEEDELAERCGQWGLLR